jgi:hypothetical protein
MRTVSNSRDLGHRCVVYPQACRENEGACATTLGFPGSISQSQAEGICLSLSTPSRHFDRRSCCVDRHRYHRIPLLAAGPLQVPQIRRPNSRPALPSKLWVIPTLHSLALSFAATPSRPDMYQARQAKAKQADHHTPRTCPSPVRPSSYEGPFFLHKGPPPTAGRLNHRPGTAADRDSSYPRSIATILHPPSLSWATSCSGAERQKTTDDFVGRRLESGLEL